MRCFSSPHAAPFVASCPLTYSHLGAKIPGSPGIWALPLKPTFTDSTSGLLSAACVGAVRPIRGQLPGPALARLPRALTFDPTPLLLTPTPTTIFTSCPTFSPERFEHGVCVVTVAPLSSPFSRLVVIFFMSADTFSMLVLWESAGAVPFSLIRFWPARATTLKASLKILVILRLGGASFILCCRSTTGLSGGSHVVVVNTKIFSLLWHIPAFGYPLAGIFLLFSVAFLAAPFLRPAQFVFYPWLLGAIVPPTPVSAQLRSSTPVVIGFCVVLHCFWLTPVAALKVRLWASAISRPGRAFPGLWRCSAIAPYGNSVVVVLNAATFDLLLCAPAFCDLRASAPRAFSVVLFAALFLGPVQFILYPWLSGVTEGVVSASPKADSGVLVVFGGISATFAYTPVSARLFTARPHSARKREPRRRLPRKVTPPKTEEVDLPPTSHPASTLDAVLRLFDEAPQSVKIPLALCGGLIFGLFTSLLFWATAHLGAPSRPSGVGFSIKAPGRSGAGLGGAAPGTQLPASCAPAKAVKPPLCPTITAPAAPVSADIGAVTGNCVPAEVVKPPQAASPLARANWLPHRGGGGPRAGGGVLYSELFPL
jgi:hypothetical protein